MEIVSSAACVAQILGQTASLIRHILETQGAVREYPKMLEYHEGLLQDLDQTLRLVIAQQHLQTHEVLGQIEKLHDISSELKEFLQRLNRVRKSSRTSQYLRAFGVARQDDRELAGILGRLDRTKSELMNRIHIAHVAITASIQKGFAEASPPKGRGRNGIQVREYEIDTSDVDRKATWPGNPPTYPPRKRYIGSRTFDQATIISGDVGDIAPNTGFCSEYRDCGAWGTSVQVHGDMDALSFGQLLETRQHKAAPLSRASTLDSAYVSSGSSTAMTPSRGGYEQLY
ncbi:hypothetical protein QBC34DRAFT_102977 [Podospora aff. communis PSN243]|uniref:Fungal N-terminal domain-containing protein n=1 Tax=Podospora aff. communis PSN243 TaxID=3040156 RepID=A0AAV9H2B5_9PEZI|nr:hypothetical protein QBC34DRAFT_102977 [Podospora aff. communis PSN243]